MPDQTAAQRALHLLEAHEYWTRGGDGTFLTGEEAVAALMADPDLLREMADEAEGETHFAVTEGQAVLDGAVWDIEYGEAVRNAEERSDVLTGLVLVAHREAPDA